MSYSSSRVSASIRDLATAAAPSSENAANLDERHSKREGTHATVDISQFNLPAGQLPSLGEYDRDESQLHPYTNYDRNDTISHRVDAHSPTCVNQNANPIYTQWNGAWNNVASPDGQMGTKSR